MRYLTNFNRKKIYNEISIMVNQLTTSGDGLRLFFTDDIYLVTEPEGLVSSPVTPVNQTVSEIPVSAALALPTLNEPSEALKMPSIDKIAFKFLGNNKRNILILVNDPLHEVSDEKGRELLRKIVKSVNLSANDFALLNYHHYQNSSYQQLIDYFASTVVFAFGVSSQQLGLQGHAENIVVKERDVLLIFSAELKQLEQDMNGKKALWASLKKLGL